MSRGRVLEGKTYATSCGCGRVFVTCNDDPAGKLAEVFVRLGKGGGCSSATSEAVGRLASLALQDGLAPGRVVKALTGIQCHRSPSCVDAVAAVVREHCGGEA